MLLKGRLILDSETVIVDYETFHEEGNVSNKEDAKDVIVERHRDVTERFSDWVFTTIKEN